VTFAIVGTSVRRNLPYLTLTEQEMLAAPEAEERAKQFNTAMTERLQCGPAREAARCVVAYLVAALVCLLIGASWVFDGPSETDALRASSLDLQDAIAAARAAKEQP
jgi:hypothetical protein